MNGHDDEKKNGPFFSPKRIRKQFFLVSKVSKNDSSGTLKAAFSLPGGNVIPACGCRVTQGATGG